MSEEQRGPSIPVPLWAPARARGEAARRARDLLAGGSGSGLSDSPESFQPLGAAGLDAVLEALEGFRYDASAEGAEALVLAASTLLRAHLASGRAAQDALWDRGLDALADLLERAPGEEGPWQTLLSTIGQVLGDHLPEQVVWLQKQARMSVEEREARLGQVQALLERTVERAAPPGRAGTIVGLHQIVQFAHQQRNMTLLSDLAQGDPDDLVRSVARQALIRAMDANFDVVY